MKDFVNCQNCESNSASYNTFAFNRTKKFGFVCVCDTFDFVAHVAFDSASEYAELLGCDNVYDELESIAVGESINIGDENWIRCW